MDLAEMQMLAVCYLALLRSPVVPIKSLVSWCCRAFPLMISAMLFPLSGGCEGITNSIKEELVL